MNRVQQHLHHHRWFYTALILAGAAWLIADLIEPRMRAFVAFDTFYLSYLLLMGFTVFHATPDELRRRAAVDDEGIFFIAGITFVAVCFSLVSLFELLNQSDKPDAVRLVLSIASAPLAWAVLHTIAAFHY